MGRAPVAQVSKGSQELRDCLDLKKPIYKSNNIFDHCHWRGKEASLVQYGRRNKLQVITDHFQHFLNNCMWM